MLTTCFFVAIESYSHKYVYGVRACGDMIIIHDFLLEWSAAASQHAVYAAARPHSFRSTSCECDTPILTYH
jgi:hypothetical protein